jgi:hypothetical protein
VGGSVGSLINDFSEGVTGALGGKTQQQIQADKAAAAKSQMSANDIAQVKLDSEAQAKATDEGMFAEKLAGQRNKAAGARKRTLLTGADPADLIAQSPSMLGTQTATDQARKDQAIVDKKTAADNKIKEDVRMQQLRRLPTPGFR